MFSTYALSGADRQFCRSRNLKWSGELPYNKQRDKAGLEGGTFSGEDTL